MRLLGVVAEYDPFHLGHAYHLAMARERAQADAVVVCMSTCFTQRGEAALLPPSVRARMALMCGADAVIALPVLWAVRDAEHFALGSVHLLHSIGCDAISFGAEADAPDALRRLALAMENPSPAMLAAIHSRLDAGLSYPAALHGAVELLMPSDAPLLLSPNNTLAVCYLRAMLRLGADMEVYPIRRTGDYRSTEAAGACSSASAVRAAIHRGDQEAVCAALPDSSLRLLREAGARGCVMQPDALDSALLYRMRTMTDSEWQALPGASEGMEARLRRASQRASSRMQLLADAKTRRYPWARLSRMCTHALLRMDAQLLEETPLPPAAWLLGLRGDGAGAMRRMKESGFPVIAKAAAYDREQPWFRTELAACDVWSLGVRQPCGMGLTQGVVRV
ncbi:MAG: nucleotidyltransferase family protein [bacterium]|nr:nucleotidyltransferase family protein [bacterium]